MPSGPGFLDPKPVARAPAERDVAELCRRAVERLAARLPGAQVHCHLRIGNALRAIASQGPLHVIYEIRREQGGVCWRAVETGEAQLVEDVRLDRDYMASDERVCSEIAVPVTSGDETVLVLDAEFPDRAFEPDEAEAVRAEAARLEAELAM